MNNNIPEEIRERMGLVYEWNLLADNINREYDELDRLEREILRIEKRKDDLKARIARDEERFNAALKRII